VVLGALVLVAVAYLVQRFGRFILSYQSKKGLYAHMQQITGLGNLPMLYFFDERMEEALDKMDNRDEEGTLLPPSSVLHLGGYLDGCHLVAVADPEAIKQLLVEENFPKLPLGYEVLDVLLGKGLVTSTGALWHRQRKLITPSFHFGQLKLMHDTMVDEGHAMIARLTAQPTSTTEASGRAPVNAAEFFSSITMAVIVQTSFGGLLDSTDIANHWRVMNRAFNHYALGRFALGRAVNDAIPFPANRTVNGEAAQIRKKISHAIEKKRKLLADAAAAGEGVTARDLLTSLLQARDEDGNGMEEHLIIDECLTFLFAGHDTTSNLLSWTMYMLAKYPEEQKKVQEEVDRVLEGREPTMADLKQLKYTKCVLQECLRLRGPVPFLERLAPVDSELAMSDGTVEKIPAGSAIWLMYGKAMTDPRFWGEDSEVYRPSRFAKENAANEPKRHPYSFTPFSAGARNCIGQKFAQNEALTLLAMLMQKFDVHADPKQEVKMIFEGTVSPKGFLCSFTPRS